MQHFHYVRELVGEGILHRRPNAAQGLPLREIIEYPISLGVNLLIYAGIADAINDAHNNGLFHGDLCIDDIYLTENAVLIDGFGVQRDHTRAPEGYPQGPKTDVYALGIILFSILSDNPNFAPQVGPDYDKDIVNALIHLNWAELTEQPWLENIQTFFITTVHQTPTERPEALDIANISHSLVEHCHNSDYSLFSVQIESMISPPTEEIEEEVYTPQEEELAGPSQVQGIDLFDDFSTVPDSVQGAATGLWSREAIAQIYQEESTPSRESFPESEQQNISFSRQDEPPTFENLPTEDLASPVFPQDESFGFQEEGILPSPENFGEAAPFIAQDVGNQTFRQMQPHQKNNDFQQQNNSEASKFAEQSHDYIQPQPEQNHFTREPTVEEQPNFNAPQSNSKKFIILGIVVGFFLMLIAGAGVYIFVFVGDTTSEPAVSTTDDKKQEQVIEEPSNEDTNDPIDEPQVTKTKTKVTKTKATRTKTKTKATRTKTKTKTKTKATKTKTVATIQKDFRISLFVASSSDATAKCKDGQSKTFSGQTRFTFRKETKCVIEVDGVKGLAKMKKTGTINCKVSGSMVLCK